MALPVVYRRKVGRDLAGAYGRYEEQRAGLGEEFLAAGHAERWPHGQAHPFRRHRESPA